MHETEPYSWEKIKENFETVCFKYLKHETSEMNLYRTEQNNIMIILLSKYNHVVLIQCMYVLSLFIYIQYIFSHNPFMHAKQNST